MHTDLVNSGEIACNSINIEIYSRKLQAKKLADGIHHFLSSTSKKVLILAYDFPPYVSVGGMRPYNWYRYLKG